MKPVCVFGIPVILSLLTLAILLTQRILSRVHGGTNRVNPGTWRPAPHRGDGGRGRLEHLLDAKRAIVLAWPQRPTPVRRESPGAGSHGIGRGAGAGAGAAAAGADRWPPRCGHDV